MASYSQLQVDTRIKNDKIRRLRGLYSQVRNLVSDPGRRSVMQLAIDLELEALGAMAESKLRDQNRWAVMNGLYYKGYGKKRTLYDSKTDKPYLRGSD